MDFLNGMERKLVTTPMIPREDTMVEEGVVSRTAKYIVFGSSIEKQVIYTLE